MQFRDLKAQYLALKPQIDSAVQSVMDKGEFILGKPVYELEAAAEDAKYVKSDVNTASPWPTPIAISESCKASVPLAHVMQCLRCTYSASVFSNS